MLAVRNFILGTEYNVLRAVSITGAHLARYLPNMRRLLSLIAHIGNFIGSWSEERLELELLLELCTKE